ncbi:MAG: hypothetical protein JO083_03430 [Candidatus Eremiobacteraeota bacterium]|nr:hypothetical protein [Candidatus Eremiobacteraeota bacterium]
MIPFVLALLLDVAPAAPTGADALFTAARHARSESAYPHYAVYATVVRFRHGNRPVVSTWDTIEDLRRRLVRARALPREEAAHPHVPHGINVSVNAGPSGLLPVGVLPKVGTVLNHEWESDPIGQLTFAVDQDFGIALDAPPITATADMSAVAASVTTLSRIGRTGTIARIYEVTDLGDVDENGVLLHHLGLRPLRDPRRYRLRELWVVAATSLPVRAIVAGIGNHGPLDGVRWRIDFTQMQDGTYLARETALEPLNTRDGRLDDVTISFEELRPTNRLTSLESLGLSGQVGTTDP